MDFSLTEEQRMFQELFRDFAQRQVAPLADSIDREERTPLETIEKAVELELLGLPFPVEYGGAGVGFLAQCLLMEELAKACFSTALTLGVHTGAAAMALYLGGNEEQKKKHLAALARGEKLGAFALSEPWAGSDAASLRTRASRDGNHYRLNGEKAYVTNGEIADLLIVYAVTDPQAGAHGISAFLMENGTPGLKVSPRERTMGLHGACINSLTLKDCAVPGDHRLGEEGSGFINALRTLEYARLQMAAMSLGVAEGAYEEALAFATTREQFGKAIAHKQAIQFYLADMATEIEALRSLVYRAAWAADAGQPLGRLAAMAKLYGSEVAYRVSNKAVQIHGGSGYVRDFPIERLYRDARAARILEGTSEIQRYVIAADILKERELEIEP